MAKDLLDAVYGSLIGAAVGDALGASVEGMYWNEIRETVGRVTEIRPGFGNSGPMYGGSTGFRYRDAYDGPPQKAGWVSDDTTMRHYMCLSILENGGRISPPEYRDTLCRIMNPNRVWTGDRIALLRLKSGMNPWDAGLAAVPAGNATMAISPIGLINAGNPEQAYQDAFNIAFVTADGHNRDGAATFAAGVSAAMQPGASYESVIDVMLSHCSEFMRRAMMMSLNVAQKAESVDEFAERYYANLLDWTWPSPSHRPFDPKHFFSGNTVELVPITISIILLCKGDVEKSIVECASFGRDCDTTAGMAGAICGALHGAGRLRPDWIDTVESANEEFFEEAEGDRTKNIYSVAQRFVYAMRSERDRKAAHLEELDSILAR